MKIDWKFVSQTEGYQSLKTAVNEDKMRWHNTLGYRIITTLLHQFFITGGKPEKEATRPVFTKKLELN